MPTPDLMEELAKAVRVTRTELNALDDLAEQVSLAAAKVLANPQSEVAQRELRTRCDQLLGWQIADTRSAALQLRARALERYAQHDQVTA